MIKLKIFFIKFYSKSNYKTNIFFSFFKKKSNNIINYIYFLINNLNFIKKKNISINLYIYISKIYSKLNIIYNDFFFFSKKNVYLNEINNNYNKYQIFFFIKKIKIKKKINLKKLKKIFTNVLNKKKKKIYETIKERLILTFLYTFINITRKIKKILKFYIKYSDENFFFFLKNIKRVCLLIHSNKEDYSNKIYIGMIKNQNNNFPYYVLFIINNLVNKNYYKINISLEIYTFDILKIIKQKSIFKKVKINIIINIPDLFIEFILKNKNWFLVDTTFIKKKYEFFLQSYYDEYIGYGSFRRMYLKVLLNKNILKISLNSKNFFLKILKSKIKIFFSDFYNRKNTNKHLGTLLPNFFFNKIYDRNNYFNRKISFLKNANFCIQRNNSIYLEIKIDQMFFFCKNNIKKYISKYKLLDFKNEFLIIQREINFHLNFRIRPIIININKIKKNKYNYIIFNLIKINTISANMSFPYSWYQGSDYFYHDFFYKNKFNSYKWKNLISFLDKNRLKCSLSLIIKNKKKLITTFDNYLLKLILIKWQKNNEKNQF